MEINYIFFISGNGPQKNNEVILIEEKLARKNSGVENSGIQLYFFISGNFSRKNKEVILIEAKPKVVI